MPPASLFTHATLPAPSPGGGRGFTLLEVLVVVLVLAVLAGVAVPALRPPPSLPALDEGAGRVEALFRMARQEAVRRGHEVTVVLDSTSMLAWVTVRDAVDGESLDLPAGIHLELPQARSTFTFQPAGGAQGDSVVVRGMGSEVRVVTLNRWSGHARVH